jgi:integrase
VPDHPKAESPGGNLLVVELLARFWEFAQGYYTKDGKPSGWLRHIKLVLRHVRQNYAHVPAHQVGPLAFKAVRQTLIDAGHSRRYINKLMAVVPLIYKWAAAEELVPASTYHALRAVGGLRKGRTVAHETAPVLPVADEVVDATLPELPPIVVDMVRFQRLTGCRPGEVCALRPADVDRSGEVWQYRPAGHKTAHLGRERIIYIGPQAQVVLRPYLLRPADVYCFSPAESEGKRLEARNAARVTPRRYGNRPGTNRKSHPKRKPADQYNKDSYGRAVRRAVDLINRNREEAAKKAGLEFREKDKLPRWHPNQLRHSVATEVRRKFGLEAAQTVLGHAKADVTQVYAERDAKLAAEVMRRIG